MKSMPSHGDGAADEEKYLKGRRQDKQASKHRGAVRKSMEKAQGMGCAMTAVAYTRAGNSRSYLTLEVQALSHSAPDAAAGLDSTVAVQAKAIDQLRKANSSGGAPIAANGAFPTNPPPRPAVLTKARRPRGASLGVLSRESAVQSIVSQWRAKSLGVVTILQLKQYLEYKGYSGQYFNNKDILLQKAAGYLRLEFTEGEH